MHIDDLTDDCFLTIFSYLSVVERIRLETVSQKWRILILRTFSSIKILNVTEFAQAAHGPYCQQDNLYFVPTVKSMIEKSGAKLKEINFGSCWLKITQPIVDAIGTHCCHLTKLDLDRTIIDANILKPLETLAPYLVELSLEDTHWIQNADGVEKFFSLMTQLKKLNLKRAPFPLTTLTSLPESITSINLSGARRLTLDILECFLLTHFKLTEFRLSSFHHLQQSTVEILSNLVQLVILEISVVATDDVDLSPLCNLTNLKELYLQSNNCLQNAGFRAICQNCIALEILNVNVCKRLFDFSALGFCTNLKKFYCSNTVQICDDDLSDMASNCRLECLVLSQCINVTNSGILEVARLCPLKEICVAHCPDVTDACLIQLVDNHRLIDNVSVQNCKITNDGVRALAKLDNISLLRELDISYNRSIDETALLAIYQTLVDRLGHDVDTKNRLIMYVYQTAVAKNIERLVQSHIKLVY